MKSINLLPRIPLTTRYFKPFMGLLLGGFVLMLLSLLLIYSHLSVSLHNHKQEQTALESRVGNLILQRQADPATVQYKALLQEAKMLKDNRKKWPPVFEALTAHLPNVSRITSMSADPEGLIQVKLDMKSLDDAAAYVILLQGSPEFEQVAVKKLKQKELTIKPAQPTVQGLPPATPVITDSSAVSTGNTMTRSEYVEAVQSTIPKAGDTEGEELLNQLQWVMTRKLSEQLHGITLPDRPAASSSSKLPEGSALTQEDLDTARQKLRELKDIQIAEPASSPQPTAASYAVQTSLPVYEVELEIKCKR